MNFGYISFSKGSTFHICDIDVTKNPVLDATDERRNYGKVTLEFVGTGRGFLYTIELRPFIFDDDSGVQIIKPLNAQNGLLPLKFYKTGNLIQVVLDNPSISGMCFVVVEDGYDPSFVRISYSPIAIGSEYKPTIYTPEKSITGWKFIDTDTYMVYGKVTPSSANFKALTNLPNPGFDCPVIARKNDGSPAQAYINGVGNNNDEASLIIVEEDESPVTFCGVVPYYRYYTA